MKLSSEINELKKNILKSPQNAMNQKNTEIKLPKKSESNKIFEEPFEYELIFKEIYSRLNKKVKNLEILYKQVKMEIVLEYFMINAMIFQILFAFINQVKIEILVDLQFKNGIAL